jgi:DNA repair exonuclease SbcCD ATPase subunit
MIIFQKVRWRNFLSTGDKFTEVQLDRSPSTLIVGQNGAGKSTLLDALSFALFGKPHRDINKPQLVNSINGKNCVVEVEFKIGSHQFKVARGIKPGKFEIYQNDQMVNQSANARDYQKFLEQNILKLNHKSFHQIVVLGSSSFIPFMQLQASHRREVIEDLLDINIFSKMNNIVKERSARVKEQLKDAAYQLDLIKEKINLQRKYIREVTELTDESIKSKQAEIDALIAESEALQQTNLELSQEVEQRQGPLERKLTGLHDKRQSIMHFQAQFQTQIKSLVKETKFYETNDICPTCSQDISERLKREKISSAQEKARDLQQGMDHATEKSASLDEDIQRISDELSSIRERQSTIHVNNQTIARIQRQVGAIETDISNLEGKEGDTAKANADLSDLMEERDALGERKLAMVDQRTYYDACGEMLKDTGIKTKIIKEYLPVMNTLVNKYLQVLDFFVQFNLDENFNETIRSRYRDAFNYASFSEGEKQRIDLALLFTWRQIARMKNSASTNLLVLDETFDSSLDHDGVDNLMKILNTLDEGSNVFVISHKGDMLDGKFRSKIEFVKDNNFSKMKIGETNA